MRKHFLLLALMALLPLAGWAYDLSDAVSSEPATITTTLTYTGSDQSLITEGSVKTGYSLKYAVVAKGASVPEVNATNFVDTYTAKNAGEYDVYYTAIDGSSDYPDDGPKKIGTVKINKIQLTYTVLSFEKEWDGTASLGDFIPYQLAYGTFASGESLGATAGFDLVFPITETEVGEYPYTTMNIAWTNPEVQNYQVGFTNNAVLKITGVNLGTNAGITIDDAITYDALTYNASARTLENVNVLKYNGVDLILDTDYTVSYDNNTDAGTADIIYTGKEGSHFTGIKVDHFTINPYPLSGDDVVVAGIEGQPYTGKAIHPTVTVTFNGTTLTDGTDYTRYFFTKQDYTNVTVTPAAGVPIRLEAVSSNFSGTRIVRFKVIRRELTFAIADYENAKVYGNNDPDDLEDKVTITGVQNDETVSFTVSREEGEIALIPYKMHITVTEDAISANYSWPDAESMPTADFTIAKRDLTISADEKHQTFGEDEVPLTATFTNLASGDDDGSGQPKSGVVIGLKLKKQDTEDPFVKDIVNDGSLVAPNYNITFKSDKYYIDKADLTIVVNSATKTYGAPDPDFTYTASDETVELSGTPTYTREDNQNVGNYLVSLSGLSAEGYNITFTPGVLSITKRDLTLKAKNQVIAVGDLLADASATTVEITDGELQYNDKITNLGITLTTAESAVGVYTDAITLTATNTNYSYTYVAGNLTITGDGFALVLDPDDTELVEKINNFNGKTATITFAGRTLKAGIWETLVLPFNTTVKAVSEAFGYAVVDRLNENKEDGNLHFELWLNDIPANTPFMVKIYGDAEDEDDVLDLSTVTFTGKTIVAPDAEKIDADGNPYIQDGSNNKLIGLYTSKTVGGDDIWALNKKDTWKELDSRTADLIATKAYLDLTANSGARMIYVQDADGSVSAINTISGEVTVKAAEGWYTINGVKLEAAPAQKGIYIHNGKKVVVK